ncbi:MAG: siroheme synthase CysG [Gammaproteobacteria bacterium]|nr:siroheme synthase CysG [Gammaproteobacteria bacterium]
MDHLPIFFHVRGRDCLLVGGGEIAARKAELLLRAGSRLMVVAPELGATLSRLAAAGSLRHRAASFSDADIAGHALVIAATDDPAVNAAVAAAARARGIPVNVVDDPAHCDFILPSVLDRSPLLVAVSTGGAAPMLARALRARLETLIPPGYGRLAALLERFRGRLKERLPIASRRRFVEELLDGPVPELVLAGREAEAADMLAQAIEGADPRAPRGEVSLIGAGPGDPDLLTFRALRLMQRADVVLYDRLVADGILDLVRRDAERIYVGKRRDYHALRQEEINQLLVSHARAGRHVVRLKGGDPFVFGRGGEEIATLAAEGVPFQVVPGITAANGCAAYAGIPLTHRDHAHSVLFVTGHRRDGGIDLDWDALARPAQTVVIYMGLGAIDVICRELQRHGVSAQMPAALIERGTTHAQRVLTGTLQTLPGLVAGQEIHAPTLLIVGEVVSLRERLAWFHPERSEQERN